MKEIPTSALLQELLARVRAREGTNTVSPREWNIVYMAIGPLRFRQQDRTYSPSYGGEPYGDYAFNNQKRLDTGVY